MKKTLKIGCFGDDFTGSSDAASFIRKGGLNTIMITDLPDDDEILPDDVEAIVVSLKTRNDNKDEAVKKSKSVFHWLNKKKCEHIYFKYCSTFDSTEDGNIGPVADMLLEESGQKFTILCPALPINGRTVSDGKLYVFGVLLEKSHMRNHPLTPMKESSIKKLIEMQSKYKAYILSKDVLNNVEKSDKFLNEVLSVEDHAFVIPDYEEFSDGVMIANKFQDLRILTGGSGILEHLSRVYSGDDLNIEKKNSIGVKGKALVLAGSCSTVTQKQIERYKSDGGFTLKVNIDRIILKREEYLNELKRILSDNDKDILIYSSSNDEEVSNYQNKYGKDIVSEELESFTAELALIALKYSYKKLIIAGGETSGAVIQKLGYNSFYILDDAEPGIPIMKPINDDNMRIVLKSGSFGSEDFFTDTIKKLYEEGDKNDS